MQWENKPNQISNEPKISISLWCGLIRCERVLSVKEPEVSIQMEPWLWYYWSFFLSLKSFTHSSQSVWFLLLYHNAVKFTNLIGQKLLINLLLQNGSDGSVIEMVGLYCIRGIKYVSMCCVTPSHCWLFYYNSMTCHILSLTYHLAGQKLQSLEVCYLGQWAFFRKRFLPSCHLCQDDSRVPKSQSHSLMDRVMNLTFTAAVII